MHPEVNPSQERVPVKLTNAIDVGMARRGFLDASQIRSVTAEALIRTGDAQLIIPESIAAILGLEVDRLEPSRSFDGIVENVGVSEPIQIECCGHQTMDEALISGDEVILGSVVLAKIQFWEECSAYQLDDLDGNSGDYHLIYSEISNITIWQENRWRFPIPADDDDDQH